MLLLCSTLAVLAVHAVRCGGPPLCYVCVSGLDDHEACLRVNRTDSPFLMDCGDSAYKGCFTKEGASVDTSSKDIDYIHRGCAERTAGCRNPDDMNLKGGGRICYCEGDGCNFSLLDYKVSSAPSIACSRVSPVCVAALLAPPSSCWTRGLWWS